MIAAAHVVADYKFAVALGYAMAAVVLRVLGVLDSRIRSCGLLDRPGTDRECGRALAEDKTDTGDETQGSQHRSHGFLHFDSTINCFERFGFRK
jgi:hypothetical protein